MDGILHCSIAQLNLDAVLANGQTFRWKKHDQNCWIGVAHHHVWQIWRIDSMTVAFKVLYDFRHPDNERKTAEDIIKEYFQLDVDLEELYRYWTSRCTHFKQLLAGENNSALEGIRILKQQPVETLFAFICSANNNIPRISAMVEKLCMFYGTKAKIKLDVGQEEFYYDFPNIQQLIDNLPEMEMRLRKAGFGYRASSIAKTVDIFAREDSFIQKFGGADKWLEMLMQCPYSEARDHLLRLPGIGPKVADCICLMALGKTDVVPVDRHVFNLTAEIYKPKFLGKGAKLSLQIAKQIGQFHTDLFGNYAGWAHSILFSTRLKSFRKPL